MGSARLGPLPGLCVAHGSLSSSLEVCVVRTLLSLGISDHGYLSPPRY